MHEPPSGTVIEFLDEFEREAMAKFLVHKFNVIRQKETAAEFQRNRCPGWIQFDVDFAKMEPSSRRKRFNHNIGRSIHSHFLCQLYHSYLLRLE